MDHKKLTLLSVTVSVLLFFWTCALPFWNSEQWFFSEKIHSMWVVFDIILVIMFILLTIAVWKKKWQTHFLAPLILGMILTDWIFNISLWVFEGYNLLEARFLFSYIFIFITTSFFVWFFVTIYKTSKDWSSLETKLE